MQEGTTLLSPSKSLQNSRPRLLVWHTFTRRELFLGTIDVLQDLQTLLHQLKLVHIHQNGDPASPLSKYHRSPGLTDLFHKGRDPGPELRQRTDIFIDPYLGHGHLHVLSTVRLTVRRG